MSFARVCATFLTLAAVTQAALVINSVNIVGNGTSSVIFTSTDPENDPASVTIELVNPVFHDQFAVGNNIPVTIGNFTFETPSIDPGPNYSVQLVNNSDANQIFAMTPPFTVAENDVKSSSSSKQSASASATLPPLGPVSSTPEASVATIQSITPSGVTQPSSSSNSSSSPSSSSSTPPSTASNPVFSNSGAIALQAPLGLLLVGIAFAFF